MYTKGTTISVEGVKASGSKGSFDTMLIKDASLDRIIMEVRSLCEYARYRKFRLQIGDLWSRWHYTNI